MLGGESLKKYRLGYQIYLIGLVPFLASLPILFFAPLSGKYFMCIFDIPLAIIACISLIDVAFFTYKTVNDKGILTKTFFVTNFIGWDEIYRIDYDINNILYKYIVIIEGKDKKTTVSSWYKDDKELLKIVVAECKKRNIRVATMIEKIIE